MRPLVGFVRVEAEIERAFGGCDGGEMIEQAIDEPAAAVRRHDEQTLHPPVVAAAEAVHSVTAECSPRLRPVAFGDVEPG